MLILGSTSDDKGSQLESLTLRILSHLSYTNCTVNYIAPGGAEIDVRGEFQLPSLNGTVVRETLCECKAHRTPLAMPDWQKFLGKVFSAEVIAGHEVIGTFIALSGVNGNVKGSYDAIRIRRDNIFLVTGDDLLRVLSGVFKLTTVEEITNTVSRMTTRVIKQIEPAFRDNTCYWIVVFSGGAFCVLDTTGQVLESDASSQFSEMISKEIDVNEFVDLRKEAEAKDRKRKVEAWCIGKLMLLGGQAKPAQLADDSTFGLDELTDSLISLVSKELVACNRDSNSYEIPVVDRDGVPHVPAKIYRAMLTGGGCPDGAIGCEFYDTHVNLTMLREMLRTQGDMPLPEEDHPTALQLLRLSPQAIARLAEPMPMITTHRVKDVHPQMDRADRDILFDTLHESLANDFSNPYLAPYFHRTRNLRELETRTQVVLKSATCVAVEDTVCKRHGIGELDESLGGGYGHLLILAEAPEPWEEGGLGGKRDTG